MIFICSFPNRLLGNPYWDGARLFRANKWTFKSQSYQKIGNFMFLTSYPYLRIISSAHVLMKYTSAWNKKVNCPKLTLRFLLVPRPYTPASAPSFFLELSVCQTSSLFRFGWSPSFHSLLCQGNHLSIAVYERVTRNIPKQSIISFPLVTVLRVQRSCVVLAIGATRCFTANFQYIHPLKIISLLHLNLI